MTQIDQEIEYRNEIKKKDFKSQVSELKVNKMIQKKMDQRQLYENMNKQREEERFMQNILEQKKQLILEAIHSLGLDNQDLPKGTGLDKIK